MLNLSYAFPPLHTHTHTHTYIYIYIYISIYIYQCQFLALLSSFLSCSLSYILFPFSQHVTTEGMALVKQAEDAASNKKVYIELPILQFCLFLAQRFNFLIAVIEERLVCTCILSFQHTISLWIH